MIEMKGRTPEVIFAPSLRGLYEANDDAEREL